MKFLNKRFGFG
jgi:hypothetical protein